MTLNKKLAVAVVAGVLVAIAAGIAAVMATNLMPGPATERQGQNAITVTPAPEATTSPSLAPPQPSSQSPPQTGATAGSNNSSSSSSRSNSQGVSEEEGSTPTEAPEDQAAVPPPAKAPDVFRPINDTDLPALRAPGLKVEKVVQGLSAPTSMAFVDGRNLIVLQKNDGQVRLVSNGTLVSKPLATFKVENASERGLLGVAVGHGGRDVFIYVTEDNGQGEVRNRVYLFTWYNESLIDKRMILDLPGTPGPNHDGGKMAVGPDGMLYLVIGDLNRNGMLQNFKDGPAPDDTSVILKVDRDGRPVANVLAGLPSSYYAYGIRNSFGLAFDPRTGVLWDTENGPEGYDEVNIVQPGFNSGWERVMGPIARTQSTEADLVRLEGSHYADPIVSLREAVGITDLAFAGQGLGARYAGDIFFGDINNGVLYHAKVNAERNGLVLDGNSGLSDGVADDEQEVNALTAGSGFQGITDIEAGPDGYLYVLSYAGDIYRVMAVK